MGLHSPAAAKKLWNFLRVAFFMMRKGLISKRKLLMDMNLMMKRGKIMGKNLGNLVFHHHHHHHHKSSRGYGFTLQEYEFSCTTSPNPVFLHAKRRHNYFPCLNAVVEDPYDTPARPTVVPRIAYSPSPSPSPSPQCSILSHELAPGESRSPLQSSISNFSSELDGDAGERSPCSQGVDDEAEEFIRKFYEQLRAQSRIALIHYQKMEYKEKLQLEC